MIRKIKYAFTAMAISVLTLSVMDMPSFASMADIVNQQLEENEEGSSSPQPVQETVQPVPSQEQTQPVSMPQEATEAETEWNGAPNGSYTDVQGVIDAINMLDPSNPDEYLINITRASYDALPMSLQIQVGNVNILMEAEANLQTIQEGGEVPVKNNSSNTFREGVIDGNPHSETGENPYSGTEYTFNVKQDANEEGITVFIRFQEDLNGDGMGDTPSIAVMYPDAAEEMVMLNSASLSRDNASLTWAGEYLQVDIAHPSTGLWTITTSLKCVFETRAYAGIPETFISEEEKDTRQTTGVFQPVNDTPSSGGVDIKTILLLAGIGAAIIAAIVIFLRALLPSKPKTSKKAGKDNKAQGTKKKNKKDPPEDEENDEAEAAKNEELRRIRADMEKDNKRYYADDAAYAASMQQKQNENSKDEERIPEQELDITVEDIDNDDAIEEYTDGFDTGILSKNWNDDGTTGDTGTLNSRFGK